MAISHVMQRHIKSNPHANLDRSMADNGSGSAPRSGGGRKKSAAPTPKKPRGRPAKKVTNDDEDDDEEDLNQLGNGSDEEFDTPSKKPKTNLNRVQNGRITKARKSAPAPGA